MIKSAQLRYQSQRRYNAMKAQFEREIDEIDGEDPICTLKKSLKNNSK